MITNKTEVLALFIEWAPVAIGISKIQRRLGCGYNEGRTHVDGLVAQNLIVHVSDGKYIPTAEALKEN